VVYVGVATQQLYPADLTDSQWVIIQELIPPAKPGGRPHSLARRPVVDAILFVAVGGIQWRMLPRDTQSNSSVTTPIRSNIQSNVAVTPPEDRILISEYSYAAGRLGIYDATTYTQLG